MNMLQRARQALRFDDPTNDRDDDLVELTAGQIAATKTRALVEQLRKSGTTFDDIGAADIGTNIAIAAREKTAMLEPDQSVAETLSSQMTTYADQVRAKIEQIKNDQKIADDAHSDAIKALKDEIYQREQAHADLTAANNERIADAERALAGVAAMENVLHPDTPLQGEPLTPRQLERRGGKPDKPTLVRKLGGEVEPIPEN